MSSAQSTFDFAEVHASSNLKDIPRRKSRNVRSRRFIQLCGRIRFAASSSIQLGCAKGTLVFRGFKYEGSWKNDKMDGKGKKVDAEGWTFARGRLRT